MTESALSGAMTFRFASVATRERGGGFSPKVHSVSQTVSGLSLGNFVKKTEPHETVTRKSIVRKVSQLLCKEPQKREIGPQFPAFSSAAQSLPSGKPRFYPQLAMLIH